MVRELFHCFRDPGKCLHALEAAFRAREDVILESCMRYSARVILEPGDAEQLTIPSPIVAELIAAAGEGGHLDERCSRLLLRRATSSAEEHVSRFVDVLIPEPAAGHFARDVFRSRLFSEYENALFAVRNAWSRNSQCGIIQIRNLIELHEDDIKTCAKAYFERFAQMQKVIADEWDERDEYARFLMGRQAVHQPETWTVACTLIDLFKPGIAAVLGDDRFAERCLRNAIAGARELIAQCDRERLPRAFVVEWSFFRFRHIVLSEIAPFVLSPSSFG